MKIKLIKNEAEYIKTLARLEKLVGAKKDSLEGDELDILSFLIDLYEKENVKIDSPDPIEAIKFRMEQLGYTQNDLAKILGYKSRASEILNKNANSILK